MKARLQTSLGQHLVLTPQLRQAIHLLQLSTLELEAEITEAVESNPLLDWSEPEPLQVGGEDPPEPERVIEDIPDQAEPWDRQGEAWEERRGPAMDTDDGDGDPAERVAESESLRDHLLWQLHLTHLSPRDRRIGAALIAPFGSVSCLGISPGASGTA